MRRFEFVEGSSAKFWMADVQGNTFIVVFGRLGTEGQRKEKEFSNEESARREYERKVAEKLREGYREVSAEAPVAPKGAKGAAAAAPKLALPPRVRGERPSAAQVTAAAEALTVLDSLVGGRSWKVALQARRARRALRALGGADPTSHSALGPVFTSLMAKVVAPRGEPRLPLWVALELLSELDASAFLRTLEQWRRAPAGVPARAAIELLSRQAEALGEPELALRMGALLEARPGARGASEEGWEKRWSALRPHVEGHLVAGGSSLPALLRSLEAGGDPRLAERLSRLGG
ncbi:WGR domain-containing protein [Archangium sp.]|uniref:WGR domain-containing protein n=1 Tax=Archangium sp. TaxID=1872627 RepID=UPI002D320040|nr:WGR domain-containing protein [Archangium sp.]HYO55418.1 WGR domain-containing protein [Archangium sp.]